MQVFIRFLRALWWAVLTALWLSTSCAWAEDSNAPSLIQSQEWLMDASGEATFDEIKNSVGWTPLSGWKSWGFGDEPIWIRMKIRSFDVPTNKDWVLRVRPAVLDYVTLYDPAAGIVFATGDALPPSEGALESINFTLPIKPLAFERVIYLKISTTSTRTISVDALPSSRVQQLNRLHEWGVGFVLVTSAIFSFWALAQWAITREKLIGIFAIKQVVSTAWGFFILGFARVVIGSWFSEGVLSAITATTFCFLLGAVLWFYAALFQHYQASNIWLGLCRFFAVGFVLFPLINFPDITSKMLLHLNEATLIVGFLLLCLWISAYTKKSEQPISLNVLLPYLIFYIGSNIWVTVMILGWVNASSMVLFGNLSQAVLDGFVMFVMLQIRAKNLQKEHQQLAFNLERSEQAAEAEMRHRHEQSQLFAMLAHELKTPLATLRMWMETGPLKRDKLDRAIADMNQVIERCVHTGQLADRGLVPALQDVDPIALTRSCIESCRNPERVKLLSSSSTAQLRTDAQMLSIVLSNLLDNACKYGAPNDTAHVVLYRQQNQNQWGWQWRVDSLAGSAGLPDAKQLFEKYYRGPQARRLSGSGLGLFLVKGLLGLMGGKITYEANQNRATFCVWVPDSN